MTNRLVARIELVIRYPEEPYKVEPMVRVDFNDPMTENLLNARTPGPGDSFDIAIDRMKLRDERRDWIMRQVKQLGRAMIDQIEDEEGWNGPRRQMLAEQGR